MVCRQCQENCREVKCPKCGGTAKKIKNSFLNKLLKKDPLSNTYKCEKCNYILYVTF
jgi:predicted RNA-binding Zn-ribbon protein involved in translation (DUF1610 family)